MGSNYSKSYAKKTSKAVGGKHSLETQVVVRRVVVSVKLKLPTEHFPR